MFGCWVVDMFVWDAPLRRAYCRRLGLRLGWLGSLRGLRVAWLLNPVTAVGAVRLGNIAIIHIGHLPVWVLPRNAVAIPAILAARIARSSLVIRWRLK